MAKFLCKVCGKYHELKRQLDLDATFACQSQSNAESPSAGPSVPGDSLRKIRELADLILSMGKSRNMFLLQLYSQQILDICSNETTIFLESPDEDIEPVTGVSIPCIFGSGIGRNDQTEPASGSVGGTTGDVDQAGEAGTGTVTAGRGIS